MPAVLVASLARPLAYAIMNDMLPERERFWLRHEGIQFLRYSTADANGVEEKHWDGFDIWFSEIRNLTSPAHILTKTLLQVLLANDQSRVMYVSNSITAPSQTASRQMRVLERLVELEVRLAELAAGRRRSVDRVKVMQEQQLGSARPQTRNCSVRCPLQLERKQPDCQHPGPGLLQSTQQGGPWLTFRSTLSLP